MGLRKLDGICLTDNFAFMELYIDNYKGFVDTIIPIRDVNFFVGENSTGKTTVLNLLEIMSNPNFWIEPDFNPGEIELGYFSEMVSQNGTDKKSFSIGVYMDEERGNNPLGNYIWLKFIEMESSPMVSEFRFINNEKSVWCYIEGAVKIKIKTKETKEDCSFTDWIHDTENYQEFKVMEFKARPLFGIMRSMVENELEGNSYRHGGTLVVPRHFNRFIWMAPIRAKARRWYESYKVSFSPEGEHTPLFLKKYLSGSSTRLKAFKDAMNDFGKKSGLYDEVEVRSDGIEMPFALYISYGKLCVNITNVGYGVSQVLPLVVEMLTAKEHSFAIQQPEVHLHPKAQAAFGELIFSVATKNKNRVIVETHSDYLINRFRYSVNKSRAKINAQVIYFQRTESGIQATVMPIGSKGQFVNEVPQSYMDFFFEEELKMLEI